MDWVKENLSKALISQDIISIKIIAKENPTMGANIMPIIIFTKPEVIKAEVPAEIIAGPIRPPIKECVTDTGIPNLVEKATQIIAPIRAKIKKV
jgi:hypothetical protein